MVSLRSAALAAALLATGLVGCSEGKARKEYERQLQICSAGEENGVLGAAADACGAALDIAKNRDYTPTEISDLALRLGRIERQQERFDEAEVLVQESLDLAIWPENSTDVAIRLIELSLILAGQDRWDEGALLLTRVESSVQELSGSERQAAANAYRGYSAQMRKTDSSAVASRFATLASELGDP
jgi:hypothetical protein